MVSSPSHTGIMLLAFGGATALEDVEPFLRNIFPGHSLSPSFIREVQERYHLIGGKSPLLEITRRQAWSLQENLNRAGKLIDVAIGMKHWHPSIPETIKSMAAQGITSLFCLILSPFLTRATAEGYRDAVHQSIRDIAPAMEAHFVLPWNTHPGYLDAVAQQIKEGLALFPAERRPGVHLIFTCHSLPLVPETNDSYVNQIKETISAVMERLENHKSVLAFQSRGKGAAWLSPDVEEVLKHLVQDGTREVLVVPLGFVSDHLETLYDLDILLGNKAHNFGLAFRRAPSLNDCPQFIEALTDIIMKALSQ